MSEKLPRPSARIGQKTILGGWRDADIKTAIAAIAYYGGIISNSKLAEVLGVSPHGLRRHLIKRDKHSNEIPGIIKVEIRSEKGMPGCPWYSLNPDFMPAPESVPPLKIGYAPKEYFPQNEVDIIEFKDQV